MSIAAVERDCGLAKDTLRVWERRYGFPIPLWDRNDERLYPANQVATKSQGLGLVISREIINKMGRELLFYESDTGASFTVSLNRAPTTRGRDPAHERSDAASV